MSHREGLPVFVLLPADVHNAEGFPRQGWKCKSCEDCWAFEENARTHATETGHETKEVLLVLTPGTGPAGVAKYDGEWGVGDQGASRTIDTGKMENGEAFELIFGQHPHSIRENNWYARFPSRGADQEPVIYAFDGHRPLIDFEVKSSNYLKSSYYSGDEIRKGGTACVKIDGKIMYSLFFRDPLEVLARLKHITDKLLEHPVQFWREPKGANRVVGRHVYYRDTPAEIVAHDGERGAVLVKAVADKTFPMPAWATDDPNDDWSDFFEDKVLAWVDIFDRNIWWFRDKLFEGETEEADPPRDPEESAPAEPAAKSEPWTWPFDAELRVHRRPDVAEKTMTSAGVSARNPKRRRRKLTRPAGGTWQLTNFGLLRGPEGALFWPDLAGDVDPDDHGPKDGGAGGK